MTETRSISSLQHPLVKHLLKLRMDNTYRTAQHSLMLEGVKPIQEVSTQIMKLFYTPAYAAFADSIVAEKWQVTEAILQKISGMTSPEGVVAEIRMPHLGSLDEAHYVLGLDGISDPGNMGTLLRTALALGWETIYFLPGGCDPFNEKVLRAARGAHFKLTLVKGTVEHLQQWIQSQEVQALVADIRGISPQQVSFAAHRVLILGNEAQGATEAVKHFCTSVSIPMPGEMESLNVAVAGGILLYLLTPSYIARNSP